MVVEDVVFSHGTVVVEIGRRRAGDIVDFYVSTMIDVDEFLAHFVALNRLPLCIVPVRRFLPAEIVDCGYQKVSQQLLLDSFVTSVCC